jgi:PAS domain-containing protein
MRISLRKRGFPGYHGAMNDREGSARGSSDNASGSMAGRFVALFEHMQEAVALYELVKGGSGTIDYRILDVNPQFERHIGLRRSEVLGKLASLAFQAGTVPVEEAYASVGMGGPPLYREVYLPALKRHFSVSVAPTGPGWGRPRPRSAV